jgi:CBS domain-containing protein
MDRNDTLELAQDIMTQKRIRHFPVLDGDQLVGVMSQRDLFHATLGSVMKYGEKTEQSFLTTVAVKAVMSEPPITIAPDRTVKEAAQLMVEKQIGCLPVTKNGKLIGMVTETDILRQVATT